MSLYELIVLPYVIELLLIKYIISLKDFHPSDITFFASCGMDNTVKIWSMKGKKTTSKCILVYIYTLHITDILPMLSYRILGICREIIFMD